MIQNVYYFLCGYLYVIFSGNNVRRFLNLCMQNDIILWKIVKISDRQFSCKMLWKDIYHIVPHLRKTKTKVTISYKRDDEINSTELEIFKDENEVYKTGLYVKDSITGIGTLSFIDPETKIFGALGHEIIEKNTGVLLEIKNGKIFETSVTSIDRSSSGSPGAKNAEFYLDNNKGTIKENTESGIFGMYTEEIPDKKKYKVAQVEDIKTGKAKTLTVIDGNTVKEYDINILKLNNSSSQKTKNILFEITDKELLEKTGGVVQGMSGSSIIQGDYIIGAVTHVVVDDPTKGYGIFITNMLEEAEN